jgi:hypothetical protein
MRNSKGQISAILILIIALFLQMEGMTWMIPNIFAGSDETIVLIAEVEGLEFKAEIDGKSFNEDKELIVNAMVTNKSNRPIHYDEVASSYDKSVVLGASLVSIDGESYFEDKSKQVEKSSSNTSDLRGQLDPGRTLSNRFVKLPFFKENGSIRHVTPGTYVLRIWFCKSEGELIQSEFPMAVTKRFGRMYIKKP